MKISPKYFAFSATHLPRVMFMLLPIPTYTHTFYNNTHATAHIHTLANTQQFYNNTHGTTYVHTLACAHCQRPSAERMFTVSCQRCQPTLAMRITYSRVPSQIPHLSQPYYHCIYSNILIDKWPYMTWDCSTDFGGILNARQSTIEAL